MERTVRRLGGFVRVRCLCAYPERFINICAQNGVAFWGVRRISEGELEAVLDARSYIKAEELAVKSGCELVMEERRGAPFFLMRFRKRWALIAALLVCIAALLYSNQFVWELTVSGNETVSDGEILQALADIGVGVGMRGGDVDIADIQNRILPKIGALSWITVNVRGSRAEVSVRERRAKPYMIPLKTPANVVAAKSGLIVSIDTLAGSAKVFPGQTVKQGQLLVSGLVDSVKVGMHMVHARADITARTWYTRSAVIPAEAVGKRYTGRSYARSALVWAGKRINLYQDSSQPYAYCDKITESTLLRLPGGLALPLTLVTEIYTEYEPSAFTLDEDVAQSVLRQALEQELEARMDGGELLNQNIIFIPEEGVLRAEMTAECLEEIALETDIPEAQTLNDNPYLPGWAKELFP